jgi:electron transfer flavoprotein beta subunit
MKIAVCIKRVPDTEMRFSIAADGKSVDTTGLKYEISTFDEYAIEAALRLAEANEGSEVTVVGLGPAELGEQLRRALSMGVDRALHLTATDVPFDNLAIAKALAASLGRGGYDLILFGRNASDTGSGAVGPMTAQLLGLPVVTAISSLEISGTTGTAKRELEGATETVTFPLPAVLSIDEGLGRPRIPSMKGIMAAKKKPLEEQPAQLGPIALTLESLSPPPDRPPGRIVGEGAAAVPELVRALREEAKVLS